MTFLRVQLRSEVSRLPRPTEKQAVMLQRKRNALQRKITVWRRAQVVYMPFAAGLLAQSDSIDVRSEETKLYLPSEVPTRLREACRHDVADKEWQLRQGQLGDSLGKIRQSLCVQTHLMKYRRKNVRGQRPNTRHNGVIDTNVRRTRQHAATYDRAFQAMQTLDPDRDDWQKTYLPLTDADLVPLYVGIYSDDDPKDGRKSLKDRRADLRNNSEGKRSVPWIWRAPGALELVDVDLDSESTGYLNEGM